MDVFALLDFFNVLGIPKTAGLGEIPYSLFILFYLFEDHIRLKYRTKTLDKKWKEFCLTLVVKITSVNNKPRIYVSVLKSRD